ncbi:MAG: Uncharacterised protein [Acidimicrobiales bacterium AG-410-I20]|nr:MAG: Uncharacterised protein [Acidimicrobiales bacterium AG-410-I20]
MVLSAIAPDAIVTAVAAKTTWKKKNDGVSSTAPPLRNASDIPDKKNLSLPKKLPASVPKAKPNPTAQKASAPIAISARFFAMMLPMFLARVNPASTRANPACIKKTRHPATISQRLVSNALLSLGVISAAAAGVAEINRAAPIPNNPKQIFLLLFLATA